MSDIPVTYQDIFDLLSKSQRNPYDLREKTIKEIEKIIEMPLLCYITRKSSIEEDDITGFNDLIYNIESDSIGIFLISNGGSASAVERIVNLIRSKFTKVNFYIPGNAYSAATMMCFAGDSVIMLSQGTLGPIDPQIEGTPAYAILKSFEDIQQKLKDEGPASISAYMPLIAKYNLPLLELCRNAQQLSEELAKKYLTKYMFAQEKDNQQLIDEIVAFFLDYGIHKTHGRSIDRDTAIAKGLKIEKAETINSLAPLLLSLHNQYVFFMERNGFIKLFENSRGIHWGTPAPQFVNPMPMPPQRPFMPQ